MIKKDWYKYNNKLYLVDYLTEYTQQLDTESIYLIPRVPMFTEVIRGKSGIVKFGAYIEKCSDSFIDEIITRGDIVSEEWIAKRLRYSHSDGGEHFDSYRKELKQKKGYIFKLIKTFWVGS